MGRSTTPAYRVEYEIRPACVVITPKAWQSRGPLGLGRPTPANLAGHVETLQASFEPGGFNGHLGRCRITAARIIRQASGETVAEWSK